MVLRYLAVICICTGLYSKSALGGKSPLPPKKPEVAPQEYTVTVSTTKGDFDLKINRSWAPKGADRFYNLVKIGYFTDIAFFRAIEGFMIQFGLHGDPKVSQAWRQATLKDDPVKQSNKPGYITFATAGPNTRTTQLFINLIDNARLDGMGFAPFGKIEGDGMKILKKIYTGYGEGAPGGRGPSQGGIQSKGNAYLKKDFPKLDYIKKMTLKAPSKS